MSRKEIMNEIKKLSSEERVQLLKEIEESILKVEQKKKHRSLTELAGLGKEIWQGVDVEQYIRNERTWERDSLRK